MSDNKRRDPLICDICGTQVKPHARGPRPKRHPWCSASRKPYKQFEEIEERAQGYEQRVKMMTEEVAVSSTSLSKQERIERAGKASAVELMAVGLSVNTNPDIAAAAAGLELTSEEAHELAERAKVECADLIEGKTEALSKLVRQALLYLVINLRNSAHSLPPNQIAPSIKGLTQALELISGGINPAYGDVSLIIDIAGGAKFDIGKLKTEYREIADLTGFEPTGEAN